MLKWTSSTNNASQNKCVRPIDQCHSFRDVFFYYYYSDCDVSLFRLFGLTAALHTTFDLVG